MNRSPNARPARTVSPRLAAGVSAAVSMILSLHAIADDAPDAAPAPEAELAEVTVVGDRLNVMQTAPVDSVFGFGKSVVETPRSVTTISNELLSKTLITGINDLVALTPGSFTQSFFGVAGSLDVRGTPGENYFRGIKRIDNPGNYPQAIGASDRIDIVRGPASPIYGPSKIGGYLNFVPKSARASTGQFLTEPKGEVGLTYGSYDKRVIHGEVGGPTTLMGKDSGYYFYGESENSGSYYENTSTQQTILQGSVDMSLSDTWRTEFGGMYQFFKGNQVAGWNRLTQDLINTGTYITGSPPPLDTNHDGYISDTEATAGNIGAFIFAPSIKTPAQILTALSTHPNMALVNPGTTHLKGSQVLVNEDDNLQDKVLTLYMDFIGEFSNGFTVTNKSFYESLVNNNENAYGFSQMADTYVFEDQLNFGYKMESGSLKSAFQFGPSIRYQNFEHGDNFAFEYFDRRDISVVAKISSPIDRRGMATRGQEPYSDHVKGDFKDYGLAALADLTLFDNLSFLGGVRYDYIDMTSESLLDSLSSPGLKASDTDSAFSWSGSLSYNILGIRPYVTIAKQSTMILGQGGQLDPSNIVAKTAVADSKLNEFGVKGSLLEGKLFVAVDYYKQERIDYNAQDTVTNNTTQAKGYEAEVRFVVNPLLTLTGGYTNIKVFNLTAAKNGTQFSFAGAGDLQGVNPALIYGGVVPSIVLVSDGARKAGIPENIWSLNAMVSADPWVKGLSGTVSLQSVDSTPSGFSKTVILPGYTLVNLGLHYEDGPWSTGLQVKNATDARYFRSNFPDLFGSSVVLPEVPRTYTVTASYKF